MFSATLLQHPQVVTGTQLEVQLIETLGTPTGSFFLGFVQGQGKESGRILLRSIDEKNNQQHNTLGVDPSLDDIE